MIELTNAAPTRGDLVVVASPYPIDLLPEGWNQINPHVVWRQADGSEFLRSTPSGYWSTYRGAGPLEIFEAFELPAGSFVLSTDDMKPTKEAFELGYATRSGITVERLHELGRNAYPCVCGEDDCEGWQMLSDEMAESERELGRL